jgi:putative protease
LWLNEPVDSLPGMRAGIGLSRNRDHAWEQALTRPSAERPIAVAGDLRETAEGLLLTLRDEDGIAASASLPLALEPAREPEGASPS